MRSPIFSAALGALRGFAPVEKPAPISPSSMACPLPGSALALAGGAIAAESTGGGADGFALG